MVQRHDCVAVIEDGAVVAEGCAGNDFRRRGFGCREDELRRRSRFRGKYGNRAGADAAAGRKWLTRTHRVRLENAQIVLVAPQPEINQVEDGRKWAGEIRIDRQGLTVRVVSYAGEGHELVM